MVDELGLGVLRDAIANQLFPGISTLQTRAKYYFLVAYILRDYQTNKLLQKRYSASQYLEVKEYEAMWHLAEKYNYQRGIGIIGVTKRKPQKVLRRPSTIYWNGLHFFNFIDSKGESLDTFLNRGKKASLSDLLRQRLESDDKGDDADAVFENLFRIRVPFRKDWYEDLQLELESQEAEFFADQVRRSAHNSLLAQLLMDGELWQLAKPTAQEGQLDFAGLVQQCDLASLPAPLRTTLILAHDFSQLMYGAHIAYNCQLQGEFYVCDAFEALWLEWKGQLRESMLNFDGFEPNDILCLSPTAKPYAKKFVVDWWAEAKRGFPNTAKRDRLVYEQERLVKGRKARLAFNQRLDVEQERWIGLTTFDYRFAQGRRIAADIREGLEATNA